ncbi:MAG: preprotein translocase subunit Sec61beta [Candidatus Woesearchaeota archaeon]|nr:MAG: preprotein translocase subunit Sec61beta [Candidatus Woesearchaeota archaeon]
MAKDNRIRLPSSTAGITSFYNDVKTNFEISPWTVIVIIGIIAVLEIILQIAF